MERTENGEQKKDKREAILQAALKLVATNGFQHTPMSLIVKYSGASAGIIYHYFTSKDELMQVLYERIKLELSQAIFSSHIQDLPLGQRFPQFWLQAFHFYVTHPYETAFLEQYESVPDKGMQQKNPSEGEEMLYQLVEEYQSQHLLKDLPEAALHELTLGVALRLARQHASGQFNGDEATLKDIAQACWDAIAL